MQAAMTFDDGEASFKDQMRRALNVIEEVVGPHQNQASDTKSSTHDSNLNNETAANRKK